MIKRFEDLICWQKAQEMEIVVYQFTLKGSFGKDFGLKDQINRATGSVMDNIAEGFGRSSRKEFINFLVIARGSAHEVLSQLHRAKTREHISKEEFKSLYNLADHSIALITNFISYLKTNPAKGIRE